MTIEFGQLVEIRGEPRQLALQNQARGFGQLGGAKLQGFIGSREAGAHEFVAHLLLVGTSYRPVFAPGDGRVHPQARTEPRAQFHQVEVVQLHQPAAQQFLVRAELAGHFARRVPVGQ